MKTLTINVPDSFNEFDAKMLLAGRLYEDGKITLGQAADIVGISKRAFMEIMGRFGFSLFSQSVDDLHDDIRNA